MQICASLQNPILRGYALVQNCITNAHGFFAGTFSVGRNMILLTAKLQKSTELW